MLPDRLLRTVGSATLLMGAFAIGWALHHAFVVGDITITSPASVFAIVGGLLLVAVGWYLEKQFDPLEYVLRRQRPEGVSEDEEPVSPLNDPGIDDGDGEK